MNVVTRRGRRLMRGPRQSNGEPAGDFKKQGAAMQRRYVALLRAISNIRMQPFREEMEALGFTDVKSYGMSGNLLFNAERLDPAALERRITARLGVAAIVRTRAELARIVTQDPFGSSILFLAHTPTAARRRAVLQLDFETPLPVLRGKTVFFAYPARLLGKRAPLDFERVLGVQGTARSARVVGQLLEHMSDTAPKRGRRTGG
jgi:uncharacterized protein (DUF1697 family)